MLCKFRIYIIKYNTLKLLQYKLIFTLNKCLINLKKRFFNLIKLKTAQTSIKMAKQLFRTIKYLSVIN